MLFFCRQNLVARINWYQIDREIPSIAHPYSTDFNFHLRFLVAICRIIFIIVAKKVHIFLIFLCLKLT